MRLQVFLDFYALDSNPQNQFHAWSLEERKKTVSLGSMTK